MKTLLKSLARRAGLVVASEGHRGARYLTHPPATAFESTLLRVCGDLHGLRFIQVGANDGSRADPLVGFIRHYAWSGLMYEPVARNFSALSRRHGGNPRLQLRPAAVGDRPGRQAIYSLDPQRPGLPDWAGGVAGFDESRIRTAAAELRLPPEAVIAEEVEVVAWADVWRDFGPHRCDLLVTDTEGADVGLLRGADLAKHRPRLVHFEHACVSADERLTFYRELVALGYELASDGPDTTAWLPS